MEEILQTIRSFIAGEMTTPTNNTSHSSQQEEVLELTEMIKDDGSIVSLKPEAVDVLSNIDNVLGGSSAELPSDSELPAEATLSETATPPLDHSSIPDNASAQPATVLTEQVTMVKLSTEETKSVNEAVESPETPEENVTNTKMNHSLLSEEAASASAEALRSFVKMVSKNQQSGVTLRSGVTIEDIVVEILKPQIGEWLDKHLPAMVKQIVEREVQKLIPTDDE